MFYRNIHVVSFLMSLTLMSGYAQSSVEGKNAANSVKESSGGGIKEAAPGHGIKEAQSILGKSTFLNAKIAKTSDGKVYHAELSNPAFNLTLNFAGTTSVGVDVWNLNVTSAKLPSIVGQLTEGAFIGVLGGVALNLAIAWDFSTGWTLTDTTTQEVFTFSSADLTIFAQTGAFPGQGITGNAIGASKRENIMLVMSPDELNQELTANQAKIVGTIAVAAAIVRQGS